MDAVHAHLPKPHDPFVDLVPRRQIGIKLTPKHYAYLKISEGCNHRCTFCIIPSMRGDLVSRPIGDVLRRGARRCSRRGVKELLVISQDTSAYGVDVKYRTGFWDGKPVKTQHARAVRAAGRDRRAVRRLGAAALRLSVPARRRGHAADGRRAGSCRTSTCRSSTAHPDVLQAHEAAGERREEPRAHRALARDLPASSSSAAPSSPASRARPKPSSSTCSTSCARRASTAPAASPIRRSRARRANELPGMLPAGAARRAARALHGGGRRGRRPPSCSERVGATMQVLVDSAPALGRKGGVGRSYADAPEIDGTRPAAAAREGLEDAEGRASSRGRGSSPPTATTWSRCRSDDERARPP